MSVVIYTDGGSRNNPGNAGIGVVIKKDGHRVGEVSEFLGVQTNNWAEYQGVIRGLEEAKRLGLAGEQVEVRMDSKLVVEQLLGHWKVKEPSLKPQCAKAQVLMREFTALDIVHIPREENKEADALANEAMDEGGAAASL